MRFWLINVGEELPTDPGTPRLLRTAILTRELTRRGHDVVWWNASVNHQQRLQRCSTTQTRRMPDGYDVVLLHGRLYERTTSLTRIRSHRENALEFTRLAPTLPRPDAIICGYPTIELAKAATAFAVANGVPIAVDFRDLWPDVFEEHLSAPLRLLAQPLLRRWHADQRYIVGNATGIIGITEPFVNWALAAAGRRRGPMDRVFHLAIDPAQPREDQLSEAARYWDELAVTGRHGQIVGSFMGGLARRGELFTVLEAANRLPDVLKQRLRLVICGPENLMDDLRPRTGGKAHVVLAGWRNAAEIHTLLRRSAFGLLPYPSTRDFMMSYPNKVGEFLSAGLPIMTSLRGVTRQMLDGAGLGIFFDEGDVSSAMASFMGVLEADGVFEGSRVTALETYRRLFNAASIYGAFADYAERLAGGGHSRQGSNASSAHRSAALGHDALPGSDGAGVAARGSG